MHATYTHTHTHVHPPSIHCLHSNLLDAGVVQAESVLRFVSTKFLVVVKALSSEGMSRTDMYSHLRLGVLLPCVVHQVRLINGNECTFWEATVQGQVL